MVKYFTDEDKRKCVCLITIKKKGDNKFIKSFKGVAKCSPEDDFNPETGLELAHVRALIKFKKWETKHQMDIVELCNKAVEHYQKQADKFKDRYVRSVSALDRLQNEHQELMNELD